MGGCTTSGLATHLQLDAETSLKPSLDRSLDVAAEDGVLGPVAPAEAAAEGVRQVKCNDKPNLALRQAAFYIDS